jgi:glycosyltransferase involved in cell wall biosynthesis
LIIIVLSYNQSAFLQEAINSVLKQEWDSNWQIVVHDDASSDDSQQIIREMEKANPGKITAILQSSNRYSKQINIPIEIQKLIKSKYVARLDGDDVFISQSKLMKQMAILEENKCVTLVSHRYEIINEEGEVIKHVRLRIGRSIRRYLLLLGNPIATPTAMYRSDAVDPLPKDFSKSRIQDWPLWVILSSRGIVAYDPDLISGYRIHSSNGFAGSSNNLFKTDTLAVHKMLWSYISGGHKYFIGTLYLLMRISFSLDELTFGYSVTLLNKLRSLLMGYREVRL